MMPINSQPHLPLHWNFAGAPGVPAAGRAYGTNWARTLPRTDSAVGIDGESGIGVCEISSVENLVWQGNGVCVHMCGENI